MSEPVGGSLETDAGEPNAVNVDTDDVEAGDVEADDVTDAMRPSRTLVRALAVLAAVSFIGAIAMAVVAARLAGELDQERDERQTATRVATRFAEVFLTYDYENLDRTKRAVLAMATGKFRRDYERGVGGVDELFRATRSRASVVLKDVYTGEIDSGAVSIVVVSDMAIEGISGTRRRLDAWLQLDLVRAGPRWLVDDVTSLNFGEAPAEAAPEGAPPTTEPQANG